MSSANPIKVGLAGVGRAGWSMHCEELESRQDKFRIVAACDLIEQRRERMAARYDCPTYERIEEMIADPEVELVDIATRSCDHFTHARLALEAGKDVFLEKPMCMSYEEAVQLKAIADASSGTLYIRQNRRFEPGFQHIREIIADGTLGEVYSIKLRRVQYHRRDDWQTLKAYGGGQLLNWGPHIIDHALRLLESPVAHLWSDIKCIAALGDAEDHLKIVFTGENGRVVDLEISGGAAIGEPEYLIWGTRGALTCTGDTMTLRYLDPSRLPAPHPANPGTPGEETEIPIPEHQRVTKPALDASYNGFANPEALPWIEETIPVNPRQATEMPAIWDALYRAMREDVTFPVTLDEVLEVMRVVSTVKAGTPFETSPALATR